MAMALKILSLSHQLLLLNLKIKDPLIRPPPFRHKATNGFAMDTRVWPYKASSFFKTPNWSCIGSNAMALITVVIRYVFFFLLFDKINRLSLISFCSNKCYQIDSSNGINYLLSKTSRLDYQLDRSCLFIAFYQFLHMCYFFLSMTKVFIVTFFVFDVFLVNIT